VTRIAAGIFVLFYAAWESVAGLAVGALVQHTNGLPADERAVASDAIESLIDNAIVGNGGLLAIVGGLAWIVAAIAAAVAVRGGGCAARCGLASRPVRDRRAAPSTPWTSRARVLRRGRGTALPE
jgi:hypothetical protein